MDINEQLEKIVGKKFVITSDRPEYYSYKFGDATMYRSNPDVVVYPGAIEEIQEIIRLANRENIPVVTGAGLTGLSGGAVCLGGILMNVSRLRQIKKVDEVSKTVTVEPGMSCAKLNEHLSEYGFIIPVAPASHEISTVGANIAEAGGGTWGMSKGTFKNYLLTMKVVDGQGNVFNTGKPFPKQSTGPDLTSLFIGSEGTMGVIVELTFRCDYLPEEMWTVRCQFKDESVLQKIHEGLAKEKINLYSFEYMDDKMMKCMGKENMLLLLQTAGSKYNSKAEMERLVKMLKQLEPLELRYTNDVKEAVFIEGKDLVRLSDLESEIERKKSGDPVRLIPMSLEGCVVRFSDTVSYIGRDIEDAIRLGLINRSELPVGSVSRLGDTNGKIVYSLFPFIHT